MKTPFRSLIAVLCVVLPVHAFGYELPFTHYTPDSENNPLPSAEVYKVYQDRLGYVWIAVFSSGLLRYDGHNTELYTTADGLKDLSLSEVMEDKAGRLWIGSNDGLVVSEEPLSAYSRGRRIRFVSRIGSIELLTTSIQKNQLAIDTDGTMWAGTPASGLIRYHLNATAGLFADTVSTDTQGSGQNRAVRSIAARRDGSVWVGLRGGDLLAFEKGVARPDFLSEDQGAPRHNVNIIYESAAGTLWGGCRNGVFWRLDETDQKKLIVNVSHALTSDIQSIVAVSDDTFWVASEGSGAMWIHVSDSTQTALYDRTSGFLSDNIHHVMQDREGNLWFAQTGGVSKLRRNHAAFESFTAASHTGERPALPASAVSAVADGSDQVDLPGLWIGTADGGIVCIDNDRGTAAVTTDVGLRNNWVNALMFDRMGRLWIGTASGINCLTLRPELPLPPSQEKHDVVTFDNRGLLVGYRRTTIYDCSKLPMLEEDNGAKSVESLWFSGYHNLYCLVENEWYDFREPAGFPVTSFHAVAFDDKQRLWVATSDHGLYRSVIPLSLAVLKRLDTEDMAFQLGDKKGVFGKKITTPIFKQVWSEAKGSPTRRIETLRWFDGVLWLGTPKGLFMLEGDPPQVTTHLGTADGLSAENAVTMDFSPITASLWVGTNAGLDEIDPKTRTIVRTVNKDNGLVGNEAWYHGSVRAADDGSVYFGSSRGLSHYLPHLDTKNDLPPLTDFRRAVFSENNRGNNEIAIEYCALSFTNERRVRYRTRLVGYDDEWSPATSEFKIRYTNLPAVFSSKEYTFEVQASNNDGVWTEAPLKFDFSVTPAWWIRWWSFALQAALMGILVVGGHRVRTHQLKKRNKQLEQTVEERTNEIRDKAQQLREQNVELEDKNQQIIRTQQQLIVQEKLASLGSLTAGIAHEIKNPLNFVNNFAELTVDLVSDLREDIEKEKESINSETADDIESILKDLEQNVSKINQHGKRADGIVRGMLLHSGGQKGERRETDINALLDENVNLAYHGLRAKDATMNVTFEKDYDERMEKIQIIPQDMSRVFLNMITNACRATREKKEQASSDYSPTIVLRTKDLGERVEVRIRDNGTGIPDDVRDKIFNPFFTTRPTGEGTGLGLSISHDIVVQEHGGEVNVETEPGEFTEFIVTLPKMDLPGD
jgi:signal transduction histidine kinase/ligand-binding sensor domain-containing protein